MGPPYGWRLVLVWLEASRKEERASSEQFPIEFAIDASACGGEVINVTGTIHTVNHFTLQEDGTYHVNSHFNFAGVKGVGLTTGEMYVIPASGGSVENLIQSGQVVSSTVDINLVIGKGKLDNQVALARVHYVISPEGPHQGHT
jgi:hypothetical protein